MSYIQPQYYYNPYNNTPYNNNIYNNNPYNNIYTPQYSSITGKLVESEDIVKNTEIPLNSFGVFPKADLSCIYYKQWNIDGTTKIVTYVPIVSEEPKQITDYGDILNNIQKSINELNKKVSSSYPVKNNNRQEVKKDD